MGENRIVASKESSRTRGHRRGRVQDSACEPDLHRTASSSRNRFRPARCRLAGESSTSSRIAQLSGATVSGGDFEEATPDPIPNSEVKLFGADGTARVAVWESRTPPGFFPKEARETAHARLSGFLHFVFSISFRVLRPRATRHAPVGLGPPAFHFGLSRPSLLADHHPVALGSSAPSAP